MGNVCTIGEQERAQHYHSKNRRARLNNKAYGPRTSSASPSAKWTGKRREAACQPMDGDLTASSKATLAQQSTTRSSNGWLFNFNNQRNGPRQQENQIIDKWVRPGGACKISISESSETSSIKSQKSQNSRNISMQDQDKHEFKDQLCIQETNGYKSADESSMSYNIAQKIHKDDSLLLAAVNCKKHDEKSNSKKSSDKSNKDQKMKKKIQQKMLVLEKIIQQENDTCTEDDDDVSDSSRIIRKTQKVKKEKKKFNEIDWVKVRQVNQNLRRKLEHDKYAIQVPKQIDESLETGTSNILDALRDELTTDNDQGKIDGFQAKQNFLQRMQLMKLNRKIGLNKIASDVSLQEISDLDGNWSNAEQVFKLGGNLVFKGMETQGEETIGIITQDEQTDFDNELCILKAMNIIQNEMTEMQLSASEMSCISKIQNMKMKKNDSFSNLNLSRDDLASKEEEPKINSATLKLKLQTNLNELILDKLINNDSNLNDLDLNADGNIDQLCKEMQPIQMYLQRNKTERPQQNTMLDLIDEDCESGGTEKSSQLPAKIKKDKKTKQVNFDVCEKPKEKVRPPTYSYKDIKLPAIAKTPKGPKNLFQDDKWYDNEKEYDTNTSSKPTKPKFKSSEVFKQKIQCKKMKKLGKIEASQNQAASKEINNTAQKSVL